MSLTRIDEGDHKPGAFDDAMPADVDEWIWTTLTGILRDYQEKRLSLSDMTMLFFA